jgi:hypothetical protein
MRENLRSDGTLRFYVKSKWSCSKQVRIRNRRSSVRSIVRRAANDERQNDRSMLRMQF